MTTHEPGLPHGPLTAEGVKLLTAGASVLVPCGSPVTLTGEFAGLLRVSSWGDETFFPERFTYIGELQPDEFITAPVGGWVSNPVPGRTAETRHRSGDEYLGKEAWPTDEWFDGPGFWIHDGSFTDITAFRLTSAEAALPDAEQVKGMGALPASPSVPTEGHGAGVVAALDRLGIDADRYPLEDRTPQQNDIITVLKAVEKWRSACEAQEERAEKLMDHAEECARRRCDAEDALGVAVMRSDAAETITRQIVQELAPDQGQSASPTFSLALRLQSVLAKPDTVSPAEQVGIGPLADEQKAQDTGYAGLVERADSLWLEMNDALAEPPATARVLNVLAEAAAAIRDLRTDREILLTGGVIEIAVRNPNIASHVAEWEARAERAEARLAIQPDREAVADGA